MTPRKTAPGRRVTRGTKNVFADLGFPDAAERQEKRRLAHRVVQSVGSIMGVLPCRLPNRRSV